MKTANLALSNLPNSSEAGRRIKVRRQLGGLRTSRRIGLLQLFAGEPAGQGLVGVGDLVR